MKRSCLLLLVWLYFSTLFAAEGDLILFDEFQDPAISTNNWFSYQKQKTGKFSLDPAKVAIGNGAITLNHTRVFSIIDTMTNFEIEFEFQITKDDLKDGKHQGFVGVELRPQFIVSETKPDSDRSFRIFAQIGRNMPIHDIRTNNQSPRRTAGFSGLNHSKMPIMQSKTWYKMRLTIINQDIEIWLNGYAIGTVKAKDNKDFFNSKGRIALWAHAGTACFRNILIRDLGDNYHK